MWYLKNDILNKLIRFLLKHCYLYCSTIYTFVDKLPYDELKWFMDENEKYRKETMIYD